MRTTLIIDDELLHRAKRRAAEQAVTVSDVVNDALRTSLMQEPPAAAPFRFPTYGRGSAAARHEPAEFADALESEDRERLRRRC